MYIDLYKSEKKQLVSMDRDIRGKITHFFEGTLFTQSL